jgi:hypothetical protein
MLGSPWRGERAREEGEMSMKETRKLKSGEIVQTDLGEMRVLQTGNPVLAEDAGGTVWELTEDLEVLGEVLPAQY